MVVRGEQVQHDGDVAEVEVEVDERDLRAALAQGDGQIGEEERPAQLPWS